MAADRNADRESSLAGHAKTGPISGHFAALGHATGAVAARATGAADHGADHIAGGARE